MSKNIEEPEPIGESAPRLRWYALTTRHQHERQIGQCLEWKGFSTLVPCYRVKRRWSDRMKEIETPLFPGYVFCRMQPQDKNAALATPGVVGLVRFGGAPAPVRDEEIVALQAAVASGLPMTPWSYLHQGDWVSIERGPLRGITGALLREPEGSRLVIGVELLQRAVAVEVDPDMVVPMAQSASAAACSAAQGRIA